MHKHRSLCRFIAAKTAGLNKIAEVNRVAKHDSILNIGNITFPVEGRFLLMGVEL